MRIDFDNLKFLTLLTEDNEKFTVVFSNSAQHSSVAEMLNHKVIAAGFIGMSDDHLMPKGHSISLGICSKHSYDLRDKHLNGMYLPNLRMSIATDKIGLLHKAISNHVYHSFDILINYDEFESTISTHPDLKNKVVATLSSY